MSLFNGNMIYDININNLVDNINLWTIIEIKLCYVWFTKSDLRQEYSLMCMCHRIIYVYAINMYVDDVKTKRVSSSGYNTGKVYIKCAWWYGLQLREDILQNNFYGF